MMEAAALQQLCEHRKAGLDVPQNPQHYPAWGMQFALAVHPRPWTIGGECHESKAGICNARGELIIGVRCIGGSFLAELMVALVNREFP